MSEEINEDNCVLPIVDLATIDEAFDIAIKHGCDFTSKEYYKKLLPKIYQKIIKLNDLAKQAKEKSKCAGHWGKAPDGMRKKRGN